MNLLSFSHLDALNQYVASKLLEEFHNHPQSTHFLPTGNTYRECYQQLIKLLEVHDDLDLSQLKLVNLDEYVENWQPLSAEDTRSFAFYMQPIIKALTKHGFSLAHHFFPHSFHQGIPLQPFEQLTEFDLWIKDIDCASVFLGLGPKDSPHIAFCSPQYTQHFMGLKWQDIGAYVAPVDEVTRQANISDYGMSDRLVPHWASTISPGTLLSIKPKSVYLVAYGENKDISVINSHQDVGDNPASILPILEQQGSSVEIITLS